MSRDSLRVTEDSRALDAEGIWVPSDVLSIKQLLVVMLRNSRVQISVSQILIELFSRRNGEEY